MRISAAKTDYAIRAAAELATLPAGSWVKTESVAVAADVPLPFLLNILAELRTTGIVRSRRGVDGGYQLARDAALIRRRRDPGGGRAAGEHRRQPAGGCGVRGAATALRDTWIALRATMRSVLETVTLAHLAAGQLPAPVAGLLTEDAWHSRG